MTPFKVAMEWVVIAGLGVTVWLVGRRPALVGEGVARALRLSIGFTIASELLFSLYDDVYDLMNMSGHLAKVVSFHILYRAIVHECFRRPYATLFKDLRDSCDNLERAVAERTASLSAANQALSAEVERRSAVEEQLHRTVAELERSNAELDQFASVASHDLREPLRMVSSYAQLLKRRYQGRLDAEADEFIGYITDGTRRMDLLIKELLNYARVGKSQRPFAPVDTGAAAGLALKILQPRLAETGTRIEVAPLPAVNGDETLLVDLFQNLIANAVKYRRDDRPPEIRIDSRDRRGEWVFRVTDNGIGISEEDRRRIFQAFTRLSGGGRKPGIGLGLAICRKIVERHGGRIWAEAAEGGGTRFLFTLPKPSATPEPPSGPAGRRDGQEAVA